MKYFENKKQYCNYADSDMKLIRKGFSLIFNDMPAGCGKYMEDSDVDAICDEPLVFIETLDKVNNQVLFDFHSQLWIRFWDVRGVLTIF